MKNSYQVTVTGRKKLKKPKSPVKTHASASIAQRYLDLQRLRQRVSQVEGWRNPR